MEWIIGVLIGLFIVAAILGGLEGGKSFGETIGRGFKSLIVLIFHFSLLWVSLIFLIPIIGAMTGIVGKDTQASSIILIAGVLAFVVIVALEVFVVVCRRGK